MATLRDIVKDRKVYSVDATRTDETAVMIDTFAPLDISTAARSVSDPDYPWSWARPLT